MATRSGNVLAKKPGSPGDVAKLQTHGDHVKRAVSSRLGHRKRAGNLGENFADAIWRSHLSSADKPVKAVQRLPKVGRVRSLPAMRRRQASNPASSDYLHFVSKACLDLFPPGFPKHHWRSLEICFLKIDQSFEKEQPAEAHLSLFRHGQFD